MRSRLIVFVACALLGSALVAGVAAAQNRLPKLPAAYALPQAADSPGVVTFNHESHVVPAAPDCTVCHPKLFKILRPGSAGDGQPITHASMEKGSSCGACHNGQKAFGIDDCTLCHRAE